MQYCCSALAQNAKPAWPYMRTQGQSTCKQSCTALRTEVQWSAVATADAYNSQPRWQQLKAEGASTGRAPTRGCCSPYRNRTVSSSQHATAAMCQHQGARQHWGHITQQQKSSLSAQRYDLHAALSCSPALPYGASCWTVGKDYAATSLHV
jgi:hypothetical protein